MLTIGFIGFGKSTNRYHLPYLLHRENITIKKVYNRTRKPELEEQYRETGIEFTTQLGELLTDDDIQLISICTPPETHFRLARLCLEQGKHVIVEKPFTTSLEEAKELLQIAKEKDLLIMPFQNRRFDSDYLSLKTVLHNRYIGMPVELESHFDYYRPHANQSPGKYYQGAFYGLGVHLLDQAVSLFGTPEKVYYDLRAMLGNHNLEDYYHVELFYPEMKVILKTSHLVNVAYPSFILHGTDGSFLKYGVDKQEKDLKAGMSPTDEGFGLDTEEEYGYVRYIDEDGNEQARIIPSPQGDYGKIYDEAVDVILYGKEKLIKDEEILTVMKILEQGVIGSTPKLIDFTSEEWTE